MRCDTRGFKVRPLRIFPEASHHRDRHLCGLRCIEALYTLMPLPGNGVGRPLDRVADVRELTGLNSSSTVYDRPGPDSSQKLNLSVISTAPMGVAVMAWTGVATL